jgi:hypothetical protein
LECWSVGVFLNASYKLIKLNALLYSLSDCRHSGCLSGRKNEE